MGNIIHSHRFGVACDEYMQATGGTVTTDGDYKVHTFTSSGTFKVTCIGSNTFVGDVVYYLVLGGGGGGGGASDKIGPTCGGGGGAGGLLTNYDQGFSPPDLTVELGSYTVTVGAGGAAGGWGGLGGDSSFGSLVSVTGGGGGGFGFGSSTLPNEGYDSQHGRDGSSGGGGSVYYTTSNDISGTARDGDGGDGTAGPPLQGHGGSNGSASGTFHNTSTWTYYAGAGGGVGASAGYTTPRPGGDGVETYITDESGTALELGGGGGGGVTNGDVTDTGTYGGGDGGGSEPSYDSVGEDGAANTGGGGGGAGGKVQAQYTAGSDGGAGGSGVVYIRYQFQSSYGP